MHVFNIQDADFTRDTAKSISQQCSGRQTFLSMPAAAVSPI